MAVERKSLPISSQAGLAAVRGGAGYQQGSPPPGAPGSRFNPRVVTREEQEARRREREGAASSGPPGTQGAGPDLSALGSTSGQPGEEQSVGAAVAQGFVAGALGQAQSIQGSKAAARMERHPELRETEVATSAGEWALATAAEWDRRLEQAAEAEREAQG